MNDVVMENPWKTRQLKELTRFDPEIMERFLRRDVRFLGGLLGMASRAQAVQSIYYHEESVRHFFTPENKCASRKA
ncbi:MAG: hypothetical protein ACSLFH_04295 [Desulfuromonadales bacterium]